MSKIINVEQMASMIKDNDTLAIGGFIGAVAPELLLKGLADYYETHNSPKNLNINFAAGLGDGKDRGINLLSKEGLVKRIMGGHWGLIPKMQKLALENKIEGYNFPQGVISNMFRDYSKGLNFTISKVGLQTFVDPRIEGGKICSSNEDLVELINIHDEEYLLYNIPNYNVALLRGTTADQNGNISFEDEGLIIDSFSIAAAVKRNKGKVFVQVKRVVENDTINPHNVVIPGGIVDHIIVCEDDNYHMQSYGTFFREDAVTAGNSNEDVQHSDLTIRKVIGRRCAEYLSKDDKLINLGIGMPEEISNVLAENKILDQYTGSIEAGSMGGSALKGLHFGLAKYPEAIIAQGNMFDLYNGGTLDCTFLGMAELDAHGNVNVSRFGPKIAGSGGFIDISQNTQKVVFCGTFTAGKSDIRIEDNKLNIVEDGKIVKIVPNVSQITFSGELAAKQNQTVVYVTERCVFEITSNGLTLVEVAPGVDIEKDIVNKLAFELNIDDNVKIMDESLFIG